MALSGPARGNSGEACLHHAVSCRFLRESHRRRGARAAVRQVGSPPGLSGSMRRGPLRPARPHRRRDRPGARAAGHGKLAPARGPRAPAAPPPTHPRRTCRRAPAPRPRRDAPHPHRGTQCAGASPRVPAAGAGAREGGGGPGGSGFSLG